MRPGETAQLPGQLSFLSELWADEPAQPKPRLIRPEDFHVGVKGWLIHAVWFTDHANIPEGLRNSIVLYTDCWVSTREPWITEYGWQTQGDRVRRKGQSPAGWTGRMPKLYAQPGPTSAEKLEHAHTDFQHDGCNWYHPGVRIIDADYIVCLEGDPLTEDEKMQLRKWQGGTA